MTEFDKDTLIHLVIPASQWDEYSKMKKFIDENMDIAMKYILWEQEFYVEENNIDLSDDNIQIIE
jgi:hypothetical protein